MGENEVTARYESIGSSYSRTRQTDPSIAAQIRAALGEARSLINVGAGAGSYEPEDLEVIAIEPSETMAAQRPPGRPALIASAESLPLEDDCVDAAMAIITIHHWSDLAAGLAEMRRVARERVVVLTLEPSVMSSSWLRDYAPDLLHTDQEFTPAEKLAGMMGGAEVSVVPVTADCKDIFMETVYGRPELVLDPVVRANCSGFARMNDDAEARAVSRLAADLESGEWDRRFGWLRQAPEHDGGLRLLVATP